MTLDEQQRNPITGTIRRCPEHEAAWERLQEEILAPYWDMMRPSNCLGNANTFPQVRASRFGEC